MKTSKFFAISNPVLAMVACAAILAGCASTENAALTRAEKSYSEASADQNLMANDEAAAYMKSASTALNKASHNHDLLTSFGEPIDPAEVTAQAYVAEQNVLAAKEVANRSAADAELAQLTAERDAALLAKQERDAGEDARRAAALAEQERAAQELSAALERAKARGAEVEQTGDQLKVSFRNLTFDLNKAEIKPEFEEALDDLAAALSQRYPQAKLQIQGYADSTGPAEYNAQLSQQRAIAVQTFLINKGLSGDRLATRGLGEQNPVASNDTPDGRAQNRRVELVVTGIEEQQ